MKILFVHGWNSQKKDERDFLFAPERIGTLPSKVDLRPNCPPVYDQGQLGSCTANAIAGAIEFEKMKQNDTLIFLPSRLFIYFNERTMEGNPDTDSGAQIRDGIKSIVSQGVCSEVEWPYEIDQFAEKPTENCYANAKMNLLEKYMAVTQDLIQLKSCLAQGFPFVFGITVFDSMLSDQVAQTGMIPTPAANDTVQGGHAIMCVGYDDSKQCFIIRNSWGDSWGDKGYCYLPYEYASDPNLANDFWTLRLIEN